MARNLHIDEKLLAKAVKLSGKTKSETVHLALTEYIQRRSQAKIIEVFGAFEDSDFWETSRAPKRRKARRVKGESGSSRSTAQTPASERYSAKTRIPSKRKKTGS